MDDVGEVHLADLAPNSDKHLICRVSGRSSALATEELGGYRRTDLR